jgi:predicted nucleic acid-binding protein
VKIYFDTSVLVAALVEQLPHHEAALACLAAACRDHDAVTATHTLAETYATLTALPLPRRIQPGEARLIVTESVQKKLTILPLAARLYERALARVADRGLASGVIYDALHLQCAEGAGCRRLHTYNLGDFQRLDPQNIALLAP